MKIWRNLFIGILVSAIFLWLALRDVNWSEVQTVLQNARWGFVPLIMLVWWAGLVARAVRWYFLMDRRVRWWSVFHIHNIGFLINSTLPFRVGELARVYLISRQNPEISGWAVFSTILTERILDVVGLVVILVLLLPALPLGAGVIATGLLVGGVALVAFVVLLIAAHQPSWIYAAFRLILRFAPFFERLRPLQLLERLLDGLKPLTNRSGRLNIGFWTVCAWLLGILEVWSLALLFPSWPQTTTSYAGLALALVSASLSIVIPFTPAGVGPFEAAVVFALTVAQVPVELRATYAVVWHTGLLLHYSLWGVIGLVVMGLSVGQVWQGAAKVSGPEIS